MNDGATTVNDMIQTDEDVRKVPSFLFVCEECREPFHRTQRYTNPQRNRFCSRRCASAEGNRASRQFFSTTVVSRFWSNVSKSDDVSCWPFNGRLSKEGYGIVRINGRRTAAHRLAYEVHFGISPRDKNVCHRCDYRACCNPKHLFLGTQHQNVSDCIAKGRFPVGSKQGNSKLNDAAVIAIRNDKRAQNEVAMSFGVSQSTISDVILRKKWRHVA